MSVVNLFFVALLFNIYVKVYCLNDVLRGQSIVYGISTLAHLEKNSSACFNELNTFFEDIHLHRVWALKAMDASGSPGPGFIYGNNLWIGSHAHCADISNTKPLEVNHEKIPHPDPTPYDFPPFEMNFVMAYANHNNTLQRHTQLPYDYTIQLGMCVPKSCKTDELAYLLRKYFYHHYLEMQKLYSLNIEVTHLKTLHDNGNFLLILPKFLAFIIFVVITLILAIVGTIYDVRKHNRSKNLVTGNNENINGKFSSNSVSAVELVSNSSLGMESKFQWLGNFVKCFSIYSNTKALVKTELSADSVGCIHGLRIFGMLWVIIIHSIFYQADYIEDPSYAYRISEDIPSQIITNSTYAVDTYLFLSGFLLSYTYFKWKKSQELDNKKVNYLSKVGEFCNMCIHRFLRLTPPYIMSIAFTDIMYTYYRKTSSLQTSEMADELCSKYWWRNILYINNLFPRSEMCLSWSWYLSIDTQFYVIGSFLLILSTITFSTSVLLTIFLIAVNIIATTYKSYSIGYIPTMDEQLAKLDAIYDLPWNRIGPYLIGLITGYILIVKLKRQLHLKERTRIFLWMVIPILNLWILFTLYTRDVSLEFSAIYMGISRTLWGIGLAWLMVTCCTGNARALDKFLSFSGWIPLSRLTYCAYLLNPVIANMVYLGGQRAFTSSIASFALTTHGITLMTFFISFAFSLLFESPFILLSKLFFDNLKKKRKDVDRDSNDNNRHQVA